MSVIHEVVVGATKPPLIAIWEDENQNRIDLTLGSARLQGRSDALPGVQVDSLGLLTDAPQGEATFPSLGTLIRQSDLAAANLTSATFSMRVLFTDSDGAFDWGDNIYLKFVMPPILTVAVLYNAARKAILEGSLNLTSSTLKFMLVANTYAPDKDHLTISQATADELSGTGYIGGFGGSGRKTMTGKTFGANDTTDRGFLDCDNPSWAAINAGTVGAILIVKEVTDDTDSPLVAYIDVVNFLTDGTTYTHAVPAEGIITY